MSLIEDRTTPAPEHSDGRKVRGDRTRRAILTAAVNLASVDGLEGLSIGRLATELDMSKSGLFAHFGSKEELQLATIEAARRRFVDHVIRPSRPLPRGRARLEALLADSPPERRRAAIGAWSAAGARQAANVTA